MQAMPIFRVDTNVVSSKITQEFLKATSKLVAELLDKPEEVSEVYCLIKNIFNTNFVISGSSFK